MTNPINIKNFVLTVKNSKSYSLIVDGFSKTELWFITFTQRVSIVANLLLQLKATASIISSVTINYGTMFLTTKMTSSVLNSATITALAKLRYKITSSIVNSATINLLMRLRTKAAASINIVNNMALVMVVAVFNLLGDFDTDTLGTMDIETLGTLDYTVA